MTPTAKPSPIATVGWLCYRVHEWLERHERTRLLLVIRFVAVSAIRSSDHPLGEGEVLAWDRYEIPTPQDIEADTATLGREYPQFAHAITRTTGGVSAALLDWLFQLYMGEEPEWRSRIQGETLATSLGAAFQTMPEQTLPLELEVLRIDTVAKTVEIRRPNRLPPTERKNINRCFRLLGFMVVYT